MSTLTSGTGGPDLGIEERKHLATLAVLAHLHLLCLPNCVNTKSQVSSSSLSSQSSAIPPKCAQTPQQTLTTLLLLLRDNIYYDEVLTLVFAANCWRWETLQYLSSNRGLQLEKLQALLVPQASPVLHSLSHCHRLHYSESSHNMDITSILPVSREKENGYLHCLSDPELRNVLLLKPSLSRTHMNLILNLLPNLEIGTLLRLAALYDPSHPVVRPFIQALSGYRRPNSLPLSALHSKAGVIPPGGDDPLDLETLAQIFLAVVIKLNQKRGWKYNPDLLTMKLSLPPQVIPVPIDKVYSIVLSCGYGHSAVIIDGTLFTWGMNDFGVLGHGSHSSTATKFLEGINNTLIDDIENVSANYTSDLNGSLPSINSKSSAVYDGTEPKMVSYFMNMKVLSIASGKNHMLAITDNGVYGWGSSRYGQVGTGGTGRYPRPTLLMNLVGIGVIHVACGQFHSLAVTNDGRLYTWGWAVHGQLGHDSIEDYHKPTLVKKLSGKKIIYAAGGYAHSVALTAAGYVYSWGCGTYGQLGNGDIQKIALPHKVPMPSPVTHLAAGYFHNLAVTKDYKLYTWGSNPACLRVQAQMQRRARAQQSQEENTNTTVDDSQVNSFSNSTNKNDKSLKKTSSEPDLIACCKESTDDVPKYSDSNVPTVIINPLSNSLLSEKNPDVTSVASNIDDISNVRNSIESEDDEDITTLCEESNGSSATDSGFVVSPPPSPDRDHTIVLDETTTNSTNKTDNHQGKSFKCVFFCLNFVNK